MLNRDDCVVKASHQEKVVEHLLKNPGNRDCIIPEWNCSTTAFCTILRRCFTIFKEYISVNSTVHFSSAPGLLKCHTFFF